MLHPAASLKLLIQPETVPEWPQVQAEIGFRNGARATRRIQGLARTVAEREALAPLIPAILYACEGAADPDSALLNLERYFEAVPDRLQLLEFLTTQPRSIEILVKLFVGSQYLTELLLRDPTALEQLTHQRRLAEFRSREEYVRAGQELLQQLGQQLSPSAILRRFQQAELLRIAACDTFGLLDFKTVILQLSLLADAVVQLAWNLAAQQAGVPVGGLTVLAFGKLGGEELNYSSDLDLVFVCQQDAQAYLKPAQQLIRLLSESTSDGFLYRIDMRLRPWGKSGPLVTTGASYLDYVRVHARHWERQALLKARPIAGDLEYGEQLILQLLGLQQSIPPDSARLEVLEMKRRIEAELVRSGRTSGEIKGGPGGIRDIEFVTQWLQLRYGAEHPEIRSRSTLDSLDRLSDAELILPGEHRRLSGSYTFLRTIEHALQLLHNQQEHALPTSLRGLNYLARRLDFPDAETFLKHVEQHQRDVRKIFRLHLEAELEPSPLPASPARIELGAAADAFQQLFSEEDKARHLQLLQRVTRSTPVQVNFRELTDGLLELVIAGFDRPGQLSTICGLLFVHGYDIQAGQVFTGDAIAPGSAGTGHQSNSRKFVDVFVVRRHGLGQRSRSLGNQGSTAGNSTTELQQELLTALDEQQLSENLRRLAVRVARHVGHNLSRNWQLLPVEIEIDGESLPDATLLRIRASDTPGFLYELTHALSLAGLSILRMTIRTVGTQVQDELHVVDQRGRKIIDAEQWRQLRAMIVLIQHFTHLLPQAKNPESALVQFRELLESLLQRPQWPEDLQRLEDSEVLRTLTQLLGVSEFLWQDFLKLQHENLFPVVTNLESLQSPPTVEQLGAQLRAELAAVPPAEQKPLLLKFRDREMLRVDLRHVLGLQDRFGMFSRELCTVAEVLIAAACELCLHDLQASYGLPIGQNDQPVRWACCALGKFGGEELGFASDLELMFLYDAEGRTTGPKRLPASEFFQRFVESFQALLNTRQGRTFAIDLRLRPYGRAGSLAVSLSGFQKYFGNEGAAWPYERQALVKLRPVAGDRPLGQQICQLRDSILYSGQPFDIGAMLAMREKQRHQLTQPEIFNAKFSSGGLVDCEYLVQALQITYGHLDPSLRQTNTREALKALERFGLLATVDRIRLRDAYRFLHRTIDALRMVRGNAEDVNVPPAGSEELGFLAQRLGLPDPQVFLDELEEHSQAVQEIFRRLTAELTSAADI